MHPASWLRLSSRLIQRNDDFTSHLGGELDCQITETTNTYDANSVTRPDKIKLEDGNSSALKWRCIFALQIIQNLKQERFFPDCVAGHAALAEICHSIHSPVGAEDVVTGQTLAAVSAAVVVVSPSSSFTFLKECHTRSDGLKNANTLVALGHVNPFVVHVCATETGMGDFEEDFVRFEIGPRGFGFDDLAPSRAFVRR